MAAWNDVHPTGGLPECAALVELAERLQWSAPELVMHYARRASAIGARSGGPVVVRAQALLAAALVRLGRHAEAVEPGLAALRGADQSGVPEFASSVRLDLAACSRGLGEPMLGCAILRPVLEAGSRPATRAGAIGQLVGCTAHVGRRDDLEDLLAEADRLFSADDALGADARRLERALLAVRTAAYHRRFGETEDAVDCAREGLGLLARLRDPRLEGGRAWVRLTWELVCAMLDDGELADAEQEAGAVLDQPVRAAAAPTVGRMMLAMVTRVLVPAGRIGPGRSLLDHATRIAERHALDWLLADALTATADLDERAANPADALRALRSAHAAEYRHRHGADSARRLLVLEFGMGEQSRDSVNSLLRSVIRAPVTVAPPVKPAAPAPPAALSSPAHRPPTASPFTAARTQVTASSEREGQGAASPPETDEATGLLTREGLSHRLQAARSDDDRPVALTLVRLGPVDAAGRAGADPAGVDQEAPADARPDEPVPEALTTLAGRVRDIAPEDAELARSDGSELAVLLPHTTRDQAEEFAATIRESAIEWATEASGREVRISTGVAQSDPDPTTDQDADSLLTAARETLTTADRNRDPLSTSDRDRVEPAPADPTPVESVPAPPTPDPARAEEESFLAGLDRPAESGSATGGQAIRDLLAPLLDHPSLASPLRFTIPQVPEPDEVPTPPSEPGEPDQTPPTPPGPGPTPEVPPPSRIPAEPESPSPEPEPAPESAELESPERERGFAEPEPLSALARWAESAERERASAAAAESRWPEPLDNEPVPEQSGSEQAPWPQPQEPVRASESATGPGSPVQEQGSPEESGDREGLSAPALPPLGAEHPLDVILGPVQGPQPRPPDLPEAETRERGVARRRERADTTSIADLLAEALAAYQSTAPEEEPTEPRVQPVRENTPPGQRTQPGRHRMPDWATGDHDDRDRTDRTDRTDWMTFDRDGR